MAKESGCARSAELAARAEGGDARLDEFGERGRERRLEAGHARRRFVERERLALVGVRSVIGGDRVDLAIGQSLTQRSLVGCCSERRVHLVKRVTATEHLFGQRQVLRCDFDGYVDTTSTSSSHEVERLRARRVEDVVPRSGEFGEPEIAIDDDRLGCHRSTPNTEFGRDHAFVDVTAGNQRFVFGVLPDIGARQRRNTLHDGAYDGRIHDGSAVISEQSGAGVVQRRDVGGPITGAADTHRRR